MSIKKCVIYCTNCNHRHIDENKQVIVIKGEVEAYGVSYKNFASFNHSTHYCYNCCKLFSTLIKCVGV